MLSITTSEKKQKVKNHQIPMFDRQCVAKIIKG